MVHTVVDQVLHIGFIQRREHISVIILNSGLRPRHALTFTFIARATVVWRVQNRVVKEWLVKQVVKSVNADVMSVVQRCQKFLIADREVVRGADVSNNVDEFRINKMHLLCDQIATCHKQRRNTRNCQKSHEGDTAPRRCIHLRFNNRLVPPPVINDPVYARLLSVGRANAEVCNTRDQNDVSVQIGFDVIRDVIEAVGRVIPAAAAPEMRRRSARGDGRL